MFNIFFSPYVSSFFRSLFFFFHLPWCYVCRASSGNAFVLFVFILLPPCLHAVAAPCSEWCVCACQFMFLLFCNIIRRHRIARSKLSCSPSAPAWTISSCPAATPLSWLKFIPSLAATGPTGPACSTSITSGRASPVEPGRPSPRWLVDVATDCCFRSPRVPSSSSSITPRPALVLGTIVFLCSRAPLPLSTSFLTCHRLLCCLPQKKKKNECFTLVLNVNKPVLSCNCMPSPVLSSTL